MKELMGRIGRERRGLAILVNNVGGFLNTVKPLEEMSDEESTGCLQSACVVCWSAAGSIIYCAGGALAAAGRHRTAEGRRTNAPPASGSGIKA